jgi:hypothetical protein
MNHRQILSSRHSAVPRSISSENVLMSRVPKAHHVHHKISPINAIMMYAHVTYLSRVIGRDKTQLRLSF